MDLSSVSGSALSPEIQALYAVKCMKMAQYTDIVAGALIEDTVEISAEAMEKYMQEKNGSI